MLVQYVVARLVSGQAVRLKSGLTITTQSDRLVQFIAMVHECFVPAQTSTIH